MNKKIKIIELFQKYANNKELPKKIAYKKQVFNLYGDSLYATDEECLDRFMDYINYDFSNINDEVEILEDNTEEIEELLTIEDYECDKTDIRLNRDKINELVKRINYIERKINDN